MEDFAANVITAIISGAVGGIVATYFYDKYRFKKNLETQKQISKHVMDLMRVDYFEIAKQHIKDRIPEA